MKMPHPSTRPTSEMIIAPDSSNIDAVVARRVHVVPDPVKSAMLLVVSAAVSVDQIAELSGVNKKEKGLLAVLNIRVPAGFRVVGSPVN